MRIGRQICPRLLAVVLAIGAFGASPLWALDCTFTGGGQAPEGSLTAPFELPSAWSCGQVPGPADTARILSNRAILNVSTTVGQLVLGNSGVLEFVKGTTLTVQTGAALNGGTLESAGLGTLDLAPASNQGKAGGFDGTGGGLGTLDLAPASNSTLSGSLTVANVVVNNRGALNWGAGSVLLSEVGSSLVNRNMLVISGAFLREVVSLKLSVPTAVRNLAPGQLIVTGGAELRLLGIGAIDNTGSVRIGQGLLRVQDPFDLNGSFELESEGVVRALNPVRIRGSLIGQSGARIFGDVLNEGTLRPRGLRITGEFEQATTGTLQYILGDGALRAPLAQTGNELIVDGMARAGGAINAAQIGVYNVPADGELLLISDGRTGSFSAIDNLVPASQVALVQNPRAKVYLTRSTPTFTIGGGSVVEGNSGTRQLNFGVSLLPPSAMTTTVEFSTADSSAGAPSDYQAVTSRLLTFNPGETFKQTAVVVNGDTTVEPNEIFTGVLANSSGPVIANVSAAGDIFNDDGGASCTYTGSGVSWDDPSAWSGCTLGGGKIFGTPGPADTAIVGDFGGPLEMNSPTAVDVLRLEGGVISGPESLSVLSLFRWEGGELRGTSPRAKLVVGPGAVAELAAPLITPMLAGLRDVIIEGSATFISGTLELEDQTELEVAPGASFLVNSVSPGAASVGAGLGTFSNRGTFTKQRSDDFVVGIPFVNRGVARFFAGNAIIESYQNYGNTQIEGGTLGAPSAIIRLFAGTLRSAAGTQTLSGDVINLGAQIIPGGTGGYGLLQILGSFVQSPDGILRLDLNGAAPGVDADQIAVAGTVSLAGELNLVGVAGYVPDPLSSYELLFYESAFGSMFDNIVNSMPGTAVNYLPGRTVLLGPPSGPVVTVSNVTVNEAAGTATITAAVTPAPVGPVSVQYQTLNGSAVAPADYSTATGTLNFTSSSTTDSFTVAINDDALNEDNEVFSVDLFNPTAPLTIGPGNPSTVTITDNDPLPIVSWTGDRSLPEGNAGTSVLGFELQLSAASGRALSVDVETLAGTASAGKDYLAISPPQTYVFNPGQTNRSVQVTINGDGIPEANETLTVRMSNPVNVSAPVPDALGTIINDDLPTVSFYFGAASIGEGAISVVLTVSVSASPAVDSTVQYATSAGTAQATLDFSPISGTLTFTPTGPTSQDLTVLILEDALDEANEDFAVQLSLPVGLVLAPPTQTFVNIIDNDLPPTVQLGSASYSQAEGNAGNTPLNFGLTLSSVSGLDVTVPFSTTAGSATNPGDFVAVNQNVLIPAGQTALQVPVQIVGDTLFEPDEQFTVGLGTPTHATLGAITNATATVLNDDAAGALTCTWNGGTGDWNSPANWLNCAGGSGVPIGTPGPLDTAILNAGQIIATTPPSITVQRFEQRGTSVLRGGNLTVSQGCAWDSGRQSNLGGPRGTFTVAPGALCTFGANTFASARVLDGRTLQNFGTIRYTGQAFDVLATTAQIANGDATLPGVINIDLPGVNVLRFQPETFASAPTFVNSAPSVINFNAGAALRISVPFANQGQFNANGGEAEISGDGIDSGRYSVANGSTLRYGSFAGRTLAPAALIDGGGDLRFLGFNTLIEGAIGIATTYVAINNAVRFNRAGGASLPRLVLGNSPSLLRAPDGAVPAEVSGTANITVTNEFIWYDGTLSASSGTPFLRLAAGATGQWPEGNSSLRNLDRRLELAGAVNWTSGDIQATPLRVLDIFSTGTLAITGPSVGSFGMACATCTSTQATLINRGTLSKAGLGDVNFASGITFAQQGQLNANEGLLRIENFTQSTAGSRTVLGGGRLGNAGTASVFNGGLLESLPGVIGEIAGPAINGGADIRPGAAAAGAIRVVGNYTHNAGSVSFDIGGITPITGFDQLQATGSIALNTGALINTVQINGFTPSIGQTFALMVGSTRVGSATLGANAFPLYLLDYATPGQVIYRGPTQPTLSLAPAARAEGNTGTQPLDFIATLSNFSVAPVTFSVSTTAGSATAGSDYVQLTAQLISIPPGTLSANVAVTINGDVIFENDETLSLTVANVVGANLLGGPTYLGTIQNDDAAPVISAEPLAVIEGNSGFSNALISVRRVGASQLPSSVAFATEAASAATPSDFEASSGVLSFAPNETLKFILVRVVGDTVAEPDEIFRTRLSAPNSATLGAGGLIDVTIVNDDAESVFLSSCGGRVEEGRGPMVVTLNRTGSNPISVTYFTTPISASPGQDYTPVSASVSWAANDQLPKTVSVPIIDDALIEGFEEFVFAFDKVSPGGVLGTPNTQLISIGDNDERIFGDDFQPASCLSR